jgi:hypothetical protein
MGPVPVVFRLTPLGYLTHYSAWPAGTHGEVLLMQGGIG